MEEAGHSLFGPHYRRPGPAGTQLTRHFGDLHTVTYGPHDPIPIFNAHDAFVNQSDEIDRQRQLLNAREARTVPLAVTKPVPLAPMRGTNLEWIRDQFDTTLITSPTKSPEYTLAPTPSISTGSSRSSSIVWSAHRRAPTGSIDSPESVTWAGAHAQPNGFSDPFAPEFILKGLGHRSSTSPSERSSNTGSSPASLGSPFRHQKPTERRSTMSSNGGKRTLALQKLDEDSEED